MTNQRQLPVPQDLSLAQFQDELPGRLLHALERRWYEELDMTRAQLEPIAPGELSRSSFVTISSLPNQSVVENLSVLNMQNVLSSFRDGSHSIIYTLRGIGHRVQLSMGVRCIDPSDPVSTQDYAEILGHALRGNFPSIELTASSSNTSDSLPNQAIEEAVRAQYLASITGIPSEKHVNTPHFTQTLDRLVNALAGERYTLLIIAEPMSEQIVQQAIERCRQLGSEIHSAVRRSIGASTGQSVNVGRSKGQNQGINVGTGGLLGMIFSVSANQGRNTGRTIQLGQTIGQSENLEILNKTAEYCEKLLDSYLERLQAGRNLGFWNAGLYLATDDRNTFYQAQGIIRGLFSGQDTRFEPLRLVNLSQAQTHARQSLQILKNPMLSTHMMHSPLGYEFQSLGTPMTTDELSLLMNFPQQDVPGVALRTMATFNVNPPDLDGFRLGRLLHHNRALPTPVKVSKGTLQRHAFVSGLTGSGKTNTCLGLLLDTYRQQKLNFLVIDPAKTEYRLLLESKELAEDLLIFTLGDETAAPFRLNPFEFVPGFPLLTHIDLIKAVFGAAFPMQGPLAYLLEEAIVALYQERGWDIASSTNRFVKSGNQGGYKVGDFLPTLADLVQKIDGLVAAKQYSGQITQDVTAALKVRLGSLLNGGKGYMLNARRSVPMETILNRPVIFELRRMGDDDEKALVMGLIFVMLYEAVQNRPLYGGLQHITLIEEAHRLLRNTQLHNATDQANPRGKAVEMFSDMMAEMRAYGEGFVVVDQMPNKLVPDVIKGSNLKIIHRLMALDDRSVVGNAIGLSDEQVDYLPRLTVGQAVVHSEELNDACLVQIDPVEDDLFSASMGTAHGENALRRLQQRCSLFYKNLGFEARFVFDSGDSNTAKMIDEVPWRTVKAYRTGQNFIASILFESQKDGLHRSLVRTLEDDIEQALLSRALSTPTSSQISVAKQRLASQVVEDFYEQHNAAQNWGARLAAVETLSQIWRSSAENPHHYALLGELLRNQIAVMPLVPRNGCRHCPASCRFGHHFQASGNQTVQALRNRLKSLGFNERLSPPKIWNLAQGSLSWPVSDGLKLAATYCLLTQATDDENLLLEFLETGSEAFGMS